MYVGHRYQFFTVGTVVLVTAVSALGISVAAVGADPVAGNLVRAAD